MGTSSAVPAALLAYASLAQRMDDELWSAATNASRALAAFASSRPDYGWSSEDPAGAAAGHAVRNRETDTWVARIGDAFLRADRGAGFFCSIPPRVVTIDDRSLVSAGFASRAAAARAGAAFAARIARGIDDPARVDRDDVEAWRDEIAAHRGDGAFSAAFFERLGAERTLELVLLIEARWPRGDFGRPEWGLGILRPFAEALATAMDTRKVLAEGGASRDAGHALMPDRYRLDEAFVEAVLEPPSIYASQEPEARHHALLFTAGIFPTDVLLRLGASHLTPHLVRNTRGTPLAITPWAWEVDPVANILGAISRSPDASVAYLAGTDTWTEASHLDLLVERWAEIDGDGGSAAAAVIRQALTHPDRSQSSLLFERAVTALAGLGEIRNYFAVPALATAAGHHIDRVAATAAAEGDHQSLVDTHRFLSLLFADPEAAETVFAAALAHTHDTFAGAGPGDSLGSESWRAGGLLGLVLSADTTAELTDARERVARREALLDGIGQISDLGLTFTPGKWVPFARTGRNALLDTFRHEREIDAAYEELGFVQERFRAEISQLIAVRLVHDGSLPPPPRGVDLSAWVNSDAVRDAITPLRADAGQRFDEILALLDPDR